jgi:hypothetical protein
MAFEDDLTAATQSLDAAAQAYHGKIGEIDATVTAKLAELDAKKVDVQNQVDGFFEAIARPLTSLSFDNTLIYSKDGMALPVDANHPDRTEWGYLPAIQGALARGRMKGDGINVADLQRAYVVQPGANEDPPYSNDFSRSVLEMVLCAGQNHLDVQAAIAAAEIEPQMIGGWNVGAFNHVIEAATESYCKLWVRFANRNVGNTEYSGQDILTFGGNSAFSVNAVHTFDNP